MKKVLFLLSGVFFGIVMTKAETISWYRIYEMFHFDAFHMYGIIGSAVVLGAIGLQIMKRTGLKNYDGQPVSLAPKAMSVPRYAIGGLVFGLGWAVSGTCPGTVFPLIGAGHFGLLALFGSALLGTLAYGMLREKLPH